MNSTPDNLFLWVALMRIPGVGATRLGRLIAHFNTPLAVIEADAQSLRQVPGLDDSTIHHILHADRHKIEAEAVEAERLASECGARVLVLNDPEYPAALKEISVPPPFVHIRGHIEPQDVLAVAMVGTRRASEYGLRMAYEIARDLAKQGITIVSGLARGIDTRAHIGALEAGGRTIGVLGCGVDVCYPQENRKLFREVQQKGAILSEFPMGTAPEAGNFPRRNRIISGLSLATIVIEAPSSSGALITAQRALEQGREVFALPGRASEMAAAGTNRLIRDGAILATGAEDILSELKEKIEAYRAGLPIIQPANRPAESPSLPSLLDEIGREEKIEKPPPPPKITLTSEESTIYDSLGSDPTHIDTIVRQTSWPVSKASRVLLMLEMRGLVVRRPGMMFVRAG